MKLGAEGQMKGWPKQKRQDGPVVNILPLTFMVAGVGFEPTTFGLWARRASTAPPRDILVLPRGQIKPSTISTAWLNGLLRLHLPPIKQVVSLRSYPVNPMGDLILGWASHFRCFQRLSHPDIATQRCHGRGNWHTRGLSLSILSY